MKKKVIVKILVDALMAFTMISLMFGYGTTPLFHEVAGIMIGVFFLTHIALNYRETKAQLKTLLTGKLKGSRKVNAILDVLLIIMMPVDVISGLIISRVLFVTAYNETLVSLHNVVSWLVLGIIIGHLYLHVPYLKGIMKAIKRQSQRPAVNFSALFGAILLIGGMVYGSFAYILQVENAASQIDDSDNNGAANTSTEEDDDDLDDDGTDTTVITLDDYLGGLTCTGCHRHCSLLAPQCGVGVNQAEAATVEYDNLYGDGESEPIVATEDDTTTSDTGTDTDQRSSTSVGDDDDDTDMSNIPTLMEYLNTFNCSACGRHCSLAAPQCGRGERQADEKTEDYNELYNSAV